MNIEQMSAIYKMAKAIYNREERLVNVYFTSDKHKEWLRYLRNRYIVLSK